MSSPAEGVSGDSDAQARERHNDIWPHGLRLLHIPKAPTSTSNGWSADELVKLMVGAFIASCKVDYKASRPEQCVTVDYLYLFLAMQLPPRMLTGDLCVSVFFPHLCPFFFKDLLHQLRLCHPPLPNAGADSGYQMVVRRQIKKYIQSQVQLQLCAALPNLLKKTAPDNGTFDRTNIGGSGLDGKITIAGNGNARKRHRTRTGDNSPCNSHGQSFCSMRRQNADIFTTLL